MTARSALASTSHAPPLPHQPRAALDESWLTSETGNRGTGQDTLPNGLPPLNSHSTSTPHQKRRLAPPFLPPASTILADLPTSPTSPTSTSYMYPNTYFSDITIHPPLWGDPSVPDPSPDFPNAFSTMAATPPAKKKSSGIKGFFKNAFGHSSSSSSLANNTTTSPVVPTCTPSAPPSSSKRRPSTQSLGSSTNANDRSSKFYMDQDYDGGAPITRVASKTSLDGEKPKPKKVGGLVGVAAGKWWTRQDQSEDYHHIYLSQRTHSFSSIHPLGNASSNSVNQSHLQQQSYLIFPDLNIDDAMSAHGPLTAGSGWIAPDSWDIRPPGVGESDATANPEIVTESASLPPHALKATIDVMLWTDEMYDENRLSPDDEGTLRVFYPNGYHSTITCKMATTARELLFAAMRRTLVNDWTKYNLVVCRNGMERILQLTESPLLLLWKWLQKVGYTLDTRPHPMEWANHTYLCSFHFRETILFYDNPQKSSNAAEVTFAGSNINTIPLSLFRQADKIEKLDVSENLNIKELPFDLAYSFTSLLSLSMTGNELYQVPRALHVITNIATLDLSRNRIKSLEGSGLGNLVNLIQLDLASNLIESFPAEIAQNLKHIEVLNLSNNRIIHFPTDLCRYVGQSLRRLDMSFNAMRSTIPEVIGEMKALKILRLHGNALYGGLPHRFNELRELSEIDLRGNQLGEFKGEEIMVMDVLADLPKLDVIKMDGNRIRQAARWIGAHRRPSSHSLDDIVFPDSWQTTTDLGTLVDELDDDDPCLQLEIMNATQLSLAYQADLYSARPLIFRIVNPSGSLTHLNVSYCGIESLPSTAFERLRGLTFLDVSGNALRKLPPLSGVTGDGVLKLRELHAGNNILTEIPDDIGELDDLQILDVQANQLVELPSDLWRCKSLRVLNCTDNFLERLPPVPDDAAAARYRLNSRRHSDEILQLPPLSQSLESLYLAGNRLGDDLFQSLYHLPSLTILSLADNLITDVTPWFIPEPYPGLKLSWCGNLRELYLSGNNISALPPEIGSMKNLRWLFVNGNRLPTVVHELARITKLAALDLGTQLGSRGEGNALKYNINNVPYEWNWNLNKDLRYLNVSGRPQTAVVYCVI
ncbi:hypothetical protein SeMB42_g06541 [Synchytrium endobioticum]|uniref:Ras-associating domain-containing protein n=1 Tax=Synchytrium endobioticum TaxID=286115 RepID=A0A507CHC3_9FUNG|nr:hypothetical protein SeMB42_g06541 [Synchytrium endobioticum]